MGKEGAMTRHPLPVIVSFVLAAWFLVLCGGLVGWILALGWMLARGLRGCP